MDDLDDYIKSLPANERMELLYIRAIHVAYDYVADYGFGGAEFRPRYLKALLRAKRLVDYIERRRFRRLRPARTTH